MMDKHSTLRAKDTKLCIQFGLPWLHWKRSKYDTRLRKHGYSLPYVNWNSEFIRKNAFPLFLELYSNTTAFKSIEKGFQWIYSLLMLTFQKSILLCYLVLRITCKMNGTTIHLPCIVTNWFFSLTARLRFFLRENLLCSKKTPCSFFPKGFKTQIIMYIVFYMGSVSIYILTSMHHYQGKPFI